MSQPNFDLFGEPIPEGWGKRGRPPHVVTAQNRNKVMMLLALGWKNDRIANALMITEPTLRKHYFRELKIRIAARDRLDAARYDLLWSMATQGNVAALKELGRLIEKSDVDAADRGFRVADDDDDDQVKRVKPLGKKEQADIAAETAGVGSEWGEDLIFSGRVN